MEETTYIKPEQVKWDQFERLGITRKHLEKAEELATLLNYGKTRLMNIMVQAGDQTVYTDARLSLRKNEDGTYSPAVTPMRKALNLNSVYMGHEFTDEQKKKLLETGNLGETILLKRNDNSEFLAYISVDRLTNTLVCADAGKMRIPEELGGKALTREQQDALREGREVVLRGFKTKDGEERDVTVQINADKRGLEFRSAPVSVQDVKKILGVVLTDNDRQKLIKGDSVYLRGMKNNTGRTFDAYVHYDFKEERFRFYNNKKKTQEQSQTQTENLEQEPKKKEKKASSKKIN